DRFGDVGGLLAELPVDGPPGATIQGGSLGFNAAGTGGRLLANGAPDLYTVNPSFDQVLRIDNVNSYQYDAWELKIIKRLHRNWQMQASYSWSKAFGQAETYQS